jgi:hypothetical protein
MFDGFQERTIKLTRATLHVRFGGCGSPRILLHGHPRTHVAWSGVARVSAPVVWTSRFGSYPQLSLHFWQHPNNAAIPSERPRVTSGAPGLQHCCPSTNNVSLAKLTVRFGDSFLHTLLQRVEVNFCC